MPLLIATVNPGKVSEIRVLLDGLGLDIQTLKDYPAVAPPEETGRSCAENARLKALYYAAALGPLTVAEDSGLEIDALGGRPGVESARFGGAEASYPERFALIYAAGGAESDARFVCAVAVARGAEILFEARGTMDGRIASEPKGDRGFGYDPIFFYPPFGCTLAQAADRKSEVSHRAEAFRAVRRFLQALSPRS